MAEAPRGADQRWEPLLEASSLAVVEWSAGEVVRWSEGATRILGWTVEEAVGQRLDEASWLHPEDRPLAKQAMAQALGGSPSSALSKTRNICKDGSVIDCGWYHVALHGPSGVSVMSLALEVTERRTALHGAKVSEERAAGRVQEERELLFSVLELVPSFVYLQNRDYSVSYANRRFKELFGDPADRPCYQLIAGRQAPCENCPTLRVLETHREQIWEWQHANGREFIIYDEPFTDCDGVVKVLEFGLDVTDRRRAEEALREADRHKSEFLAVLSHELRNPLAPIRNSVWILERATPGGEQARRAHAVINRQVTHLTRLVDDLLDVTRISRGKVRLQRARLDLADVVRRTVEDYRTLLEGHVVATALPDEAVWIDGDSTRLGQAIGNLLSNAAKFTPRAGKVSVSLTRTEGEAVLEVADTGEGIDAGTLERLFEPFAQSELSLDRSRGGLGLGLALVKGLVELHGGQVSAQSEGPGRGARFSVRIPLDERVAAASATQPVVLPGHAGRRVLIIEDNKDAADSLQEALALHGHQAAVAYDGPTGVAMARETRPEIVLCDIGLPLEMNGYAVAHALRQDAATASSYLIALTGYAQPDDRRRAYAAGFNAHLGKPPDLEILQRLLAKAPAGEA